MKKPSAGLVVYKTDEQGKIMVLLVHPGGPFWARKDSGAWSIPKGEYERDEEPLAAAKREFQEEIGQSPPQGEYIPLGECTRQDGKVITAWAVDGDIDARHITSNTFTLEWPPRSGSTKSFPEVDKADWFSFSEAPAKLHSGQEVFLVRLAEKLGTDMPSS